MCNVENEKSSEKFSDFLKSSWVRSSIILGIILAVIGLTILFILKFLNIGNTQWFLDVKAFVLNYGLIGVFFVTILAGTLVPLGSPAFVTATALLGVPKIPLILIATTGFTIGMMINYGLAYRLGSPYVARKVSAEKLREITRLFNRWGWTLYTIFGFIPVFPVELLSFICGLLKIRSDLLLILSFIPRLVVFTILAYFGEYAGIWIGII
ncbi:MAG: VTT domain-containing protein [Candidatus Bathyarchaeia archaeon]